MRLRLLGQTGLFVSEVGFGAWQLERAGAWSGMGEETARRLVERALELGANLFDTAPSYGESECLLGRSLAHARDRVVLVTKFGHTPDGRRDFDVKRLAPALETSLSRLNTDRVDVLLLHNPPEELLSGAHPI